MTKEQYKIVALTAVGGALEFYDFTIYALFSSYISQHFFANTNPLVALFNTFAVFALGYLARPLGGIVFGHLGDKYGRKSAFSLAVFIMATATLLMGCLPGYQTLGVLAPILLTGLRLLQGFSVGGEIPGAAVFIVEHIPRQRRGMSIGLVFMCITLGNSLGSGVGWILTYFLNQEQMMAWGWRIPFLLGFILGIISYIIRKKAVETPVFIQMLEQKKSYKIPLSVLLKQKRMKLFNAFLLTAAASCMISLFLYLPSYLATIIKMNVSHSYLINVICFLSFALMTAFFGFLSDTMYRKKLLVTGALLLMVFSYPLFYGLTTWGGPFVWVFSLGFALLGGIINGSYVVWITESFPPNLRYSGVGLGYSLGIALFGGFAPLAFTGLIHLSKLNEAPAFYVIFCAFLSLCGMLLNKNEASTKKDEQIKGLLSM